MHMTDSITRYSHFKNVQNVCDFFLKKSNAISKLCVTVCLVGKNKFVDFVMNQEFGVNEAILVLFFRYNLKLGGIISIFPTLPQMSYVL